MIRLTERQVLSVHEMMIKATGGLDGVHDMGIRLERPISGIRRKGSLSLAAIESGSDMSFGYFQSSVH